MDFKSLVIFSDYPYVAFTFVMVNASEYWVINNLVLRIPLSSAYPAL